MSHDGDGWRVCVPGQQDREFSTFDEAASTLWPERRIRDHRPWAIGYIGYEACAEIAGGMPARTWQDGMPSGWLMLEPRRDGQSDPLPAAASPATAWRASLDDQAYRRAVDAIRIDIAAGDVYQVNLTRRFERHMSGDLGPMVAAAAVGSAPEYLAHFMLDGDRELVCASMELLLRRRGARLETHPIKGTRPRGSTQQKDDALRCELETDPKEAAELAMIVDLERHDLGRIAVPGSVRVTEPGMVVSWPTIHHRVARIEARGKTGLEWWQAVAAMVPGGSVTGCPKIAAMAVISRLEPVPRGPYCGALGVVSGNGDLELALPIRTAWREGDRVACSAGCGIVWESDAVLEERESRLKVVRWVAGVVE